MGEVVLSGTWIKTMASVRRQGPALPVTQVTGGWTGAGNASYLKEMTKPCVWLSTDNEGEISSQKDEEKGSVRRLVLLATHPPSLKLWFCSSLLSLSDLL